jgi:hypothetical protein
LLSYCLSDFFFQPMRCSCIGYASRGQRDFILAFADRLVEDLALRT